MFYNTNITQILLLKYCVPTLLMLIYSLTNLGRVSNKYIPGPNSPTLIMDNNVTVCAAL